MKKILLSLIVVGSVLTADAQYFEHTYGTPRNEYPRSGQNVTTTVGHVMAGATDWLCGQDLTLTRTDGDGRITTAAEFNNIYRIATPAGVQIATFGTRVIELTTGNLLVVGNYRAVTTVSQNGVFAALFSPAGKMLGVQSFQVAPPSGFIELNSVTQSTSNPNMAIATGSADYWNGFATGIGTVIINFDVNTLACNWGFVYNYGPLTAPPSTFGQDIVESPYSPWGPQEVCVVGRTQSAAGAPFDGIFIEVDLNNGNMTAPGGAVQIFSTPQDDQFWGIEIANAPCNGTGFVIVGYTNGFSAAGDYDVWVTKIDPTGTIVWWENTYDYSQFQKNDYAYDIIERWNPVSFTWEYYTIGYTDKGSIGADDDMVVNKLDKCGFGIGEFTYGGIGRDRGFEIDMDEVGGANPAPGLACYGVSNSFPNFPLTGGDDAYLVKAYFNGVSGVNCPYSISTPTTYNQTLSPYRVQFMILYQMLCSPLKDNGHVQMNDYEICYSVMNPAGSNARMANQPALVPGNTVNSYPNPIDATNGHLNIDYDSPADATIEIRLTDITGRVVSTQSLRVLTGKQTLSVDFGTGLATGVYQLDITDNGVTTTAHVAVK